jgi:hypothetical protein
MRRVLNLANVYKELWQGESRRRFWIRAGNVLHATEALRFIDAACFTSSGEGGAYDPSR